MTNIKEKVLKEVWITKALLSEAKKIVPKEIIRTKKAIDLALKYRDSEVEKVIEDFDTEPHGYSKCVNMDKMKKELKKELGIK